MNAREIVTAFDGRWMGSYGTCRCPAHDDHDPSLAVRHGEDGAVLVKCHAGCEQRDVISALQARGLWPGRSKMRESDPREAEKRRRDREHGKARRIEAARAIWRQSQPIAGSLVETYLRERGIHPSWPTTLRYLPDAKHGATGLSLPALIAAVSAWPSRQVIAVQRTFITQDGTRKAPVTPAKMMLGCVRTGAVRLQPHGPTLLLAEGIETALSVQQESGLPAWAALSAGGLVQVIVPDDVVEIIICADHDHAGQKAAERAAARFQEAGKQVRVAMPEAKGQDFNDILRATA
jgi:phage/plasmid primase-like uncharacterized protein